MKVRVQKLLNSIKADDALYDSKLIYLQYLKDLKKDLHVGEKMIVIDLDEKDTAHACDSCHHKICHESISYQIQYQQREKSCHSSFE